MSETHPKDSLPTMMNLGTSGLLAALLLHEGSNICPACRGIFQHGHGRIPLELAQQAEQQMSPWVGRGGQDPDAPPLMTDMFAHHPNGRSMQQAAAMGCYLCRIAWKRLGANLQRLVLDFDASRTTAEAFTYCWLMDIARWDPSGTNTPHRKDPSGLRYMWTIIYAGDAQRAIPSLDYRKITLFTMVPTEEISHVDMAEGISLSTNSEPSFELAKQWYTECCRDHVLCNSVHDPEWMPTRLVCVGDTDDNTVRVVLSATISPEPYCSLSHCWGNEQILKLTKDTLSRFQKGIPVSDLSKTFREAIIVCRRLGVRYIWIDSLCIIQDDKSDWNKEALQMHNVYMYSSCNISATASKSGSEGLFRERDPADFRTCSTKISWLQKDADYRILDLRTWQSQIDESPLNARAWVVQERLLAPRHLYFGASQVYWECCEQRAAEQYPKGLPHAIHGGGGGPQAKLRKQFDGTVCPVGAGWNSVVIDYTKSLLTYSTDKMIALSGIVKRYESALQDTFLAGLWKKNPEQDLLWYVNRCLQIDGSPSIRPQPLRAPTFSWLSIDGEITPDSGYNLDDFVAKVHSLDVDQTENGVVGGRLRVEGTLRQIKMSRIQNPDGSLIWLIHGRMLQNEGSIQGIGVGMMDVDGEYADVNYGLPVRTNFAGQGLGGLVLSPTGAAPGEYRRLGLFMLAGNLGSMIDEPNDGEDQYPCEAYDSVTRTHVLSII